MNESHIGKHSFDAIAEFRLRGGIMVLKARLRIWVVLISALVIASGCGKREVIRLKSMQLLMSFALKRI